MTQSAVVKNAVADSVEIHGECMSASGQLLCTWKFLDWDAFEIDVHGKVDVVKVTNIAMICIAVKRRVSAPVTHIKYIVSSGGNKWESVSPVTLANPEVVAGGFNELFRAIINDRNQSQRIHPTP